MSCIITQKSRTSIRGKLHHCQTYRRHLSHRQKQTAFSSRDSFPYDESRHDSYPQFPRSSLGTRGLQTRSDKKKRLHFKSLALLTQARLINVKTTLFFITEVKECVLKCDRMVAVQTCSDTRKGENDAWKYHFK